MSIPVTNRPPAVPRRVVLYGLLLSVSLALLGVIGSYLVSSLNGDYQEIVSRQLPSLSVVREISQANGNGRRLVEALPQHLSDPEVAQVRARIADIRDENTLRLAKLEDLLDSETGVQLIAQLRATRKAYHNQVDKYIKALETGIEEGAQIGWRTKIESLDFEYVSAQDRLAEYCSRSASSRGEDLTRRSKQLTFFFLVIAAWPLILAVAFFLFGLISTLVLFYRARR